MDSPHHQKEAEALAALNALDELFNDPGARAGRKLFPRGSSRERMLLGFVRLRRAIKAQGLPRVIRKVGGRILRKLGLRPPLPAAPVTNAPPSLAAPPAAVTAPVAVEKIREVVRDAGHLWALAEQYEQSVHVATAADSRPEVNYVPLDEALEPPQDPPVKLVAFYLPQFHPIPENDKWWGRGFTEWTNVSKAVPMYRGHYEPHLPGELGFYDLRVPEVQERQVELAKKYGLHGFAFYYYWFAGRRLLEKPLETFVNNPRIDFPFCIMWANENWTRRWDGMEDDVLMEQIHTPETDIRFIEDLKPYLQHKNYIRVQGRPVIMIYRAQMLPDPHATAKRWREYCLKHDLGDPLLIAAQSFGLMDPEEVGFDAAVQFPPHNEHRGLAAPKYPRKDAVRLINPEFKGFAFSYPALVSNKVAESDNISYTRFETAFPMWDNCARKPDSGFSFAFSSPRLYKLWLQASCKRTLADPKNPERLLFINAWNEWAEGAHLEPDRRHGYAFLKATREVLEDASLSHAKRASEPLSDNAIVVFDPGYVGSEAVVRAVSGAVHVSEICEEESARELKLDRLCRPCSSIRPSATYSFITVVREPVSRSLDAFVANIEYLIPNICDRITSNDLCAEELHELFLEFVDHERFPTWFERQFEPVLNLNVFTRPFDAARGFAEYESPAGKVLLLRSEDIATKGVAALATFSGRSVSFSASPTVEGSELVRSLFAQKGLPDSFLSAVYSTQYAKHFYSQEELSALYGKWADNPWAAFGASSEEAAGLSFGQWGHDRPDA